MKTCLKCHENKTPEEFRIRKSNGRKSIRSTCRSCEIAKAGQEFRERGSATRLRMKRTRWAIRCKTRALKLGIPATLMGSDITKIWKEQNGKCALTGLELTEAPEDSMGARWNSPTIDRIVPEEGYTRENCRIILGCINMFKGDMSDNKMYELAELLLSSRKR